MFESNDEARGYLAAIIDGEGCVHSPPKRGVYISNTDPAIIAATVGACRQLGIVCTVREYRRYPTPGKRAWRVAIRWQPNLRRLLEVVTLRSPGKQARLEESVASYQHRSHIGPGRFSRS